MKNIKGKRAIFITLHSLCILSAVSMIITIIKNGWQITPLAQVLMGVIIVFVVSAEIVKKKWLEG